MCLILLVEKGEAKKMEVHPKLAPNIPSFQNVFQNDLPKGLPPLQGIEHQIDLMHVLHYLTNQHIDVILKKFKSMDSFISAKLKATRIVPRPSSSFNRLQH